MALWMEAGSEPNTDAERADLDAISALKEAAAVELKEKGNEYVKKGKKHFVHAIDCYTRAINQQVLSEKDTSVLFANRAHVNLLLGNNRRALEDAQQAIKLSQTNIKSFYRAAKASLSLGFLREAKSYCEKGLEISPENEELRKLLHQVNSKLLDLEKREINALKSLKAAKDLVSAIGNRGLTIGEAMYRELTGPKKPILDDNNILHWPVVLLYPEVMSSDMIEDFCETDMFSSHLDIISLVIASCLINYKYNIITKKKKKTNTLYAYQGFAFICIDQHYLFAFSTFIFVLDLRTCIQKAVYLCPGIRKKHIHVMLLNCTMRLAWLLLYQRERFFITF